MLQWTWGCIYLFGLLFLFSLSKNPEVELLDPMRVPVLIFWVTSYCFSQWLYQFTFPPRVQRGSLYSTFLPMLISYVFGDSHTNRCKVISPCGFDSHFPLISDIEHLLCATCWPFEYLLWKNVFSDSLFIF